MTFLYGDPDRPLITGSSTTATRAPLRAAGRPDPERLAEQEFQGRGCGELQRDPDGDKKDEELLYLHAEKDQAVTVENDQRVMIGRDRSVAVENDHGESVGGNETLSVTGDRARTVTGNESISIDKDQSTGVSQNRTVTVSKDQTHAVSGAWTVSVTKDLTETIDGQHSETGSWKAPLGGSRRY